MDIQLHLEDDVLELAADDNTFMLEQMSVRGSKFSLHATELGITTIHVSSILQSRCHDDIFSHRSFIPIIVISRDIVYNMNTLLLILCLTAAQNMNFVSGHC